MTAGHARRANNGGEASHWNGKTMAGTDEFLKRGKPCIGPICTEGGQRPQGLTKTHDSFAKGDEFCTLCRNSMPEEKPVPRYMPGNKAVTVRKPPKPADLPKTFGEMKPPPAQPSIAETVKKQLAAILPEMVQAEIRRAFRDAGKEPKC